MCILSKNGLLFRAIYYQATCWDMKSGSVGPHGQNNILNHLSCIAVVQELVIECLPSKCEAVSSHAS
jgi:hypothetical protein